MLLVPLRTVMQKAEKRFQAIFQKYSNHGFKNIDFCELDVNKKLFWYRYFICKKINTVLLLGIFVILMVLIHSNPMKHSSCLIDMPSDASKWFREPEFCDICEGVSEVLKIKNVSTSDFYTNFIAPSRPVVVADGARYWSAVKTFDFDFFKELYALSDDEESSYCQFFPYKTEFSSLQEALEMDPKRARLEEGQKPWYIGWSNCNDNFGKILRQHYEAPYFLPNTSENIALNWIFMGGPGPGAHMHVDNVQFPSWQAQLKGKKMWRLAPPPECYYKCEEMQVIVESGEIIVVDTNRWYHQTFILPGEISITIGSEFD